MANHPISLFASASQPQASHLQRSYHRSHVPSAEPMEQHAARPAHRPIPRAQRRMQRLARNLMLDADASLHAGNGWRADQRRVARRVERLVGLRLAIVADLLLAQHYLLEDDAGESGGSDRAALLLEGAPQRLLACWYFQRGEACPPERDLLAQVERDSPPVAWRLRMALRAPHASAKLGHCWALLALIAA